MGLWLLQECRREWARKGKEYSYAELVKLAEKATPFKCLVNPDDLRFLHPGNMPQTIADFCVSTGQPAPQTIGETARCIFESLAFAYRKVFDLFEHFTN